VHAEDRDQQRVETEQELQRLREQIKQLQSNQQKTRSKLSTEQKALKDADIAINRSTKTLRATQRDLQASERKLADLKEERIQLDKKKLAQQDALRDQIRAAYMNGNQEYIKVLLNQEDPSKLARTLMYYDYLNKARAERIAELKTTLERLAEVIINIDQEQQQLARLEAEQRAQNNKLTRLKNERQEVVAELQKQVISDEKKLAEWQANESDLISILEALKQQIAQIIPQQALNGLSKLRGQLNWPVNGRLKERFGRKREDSQAKWSGVLISARSGQDVQAIYHGRVVYSDYLRGFGLITIIDHGDGYMSLYGHNEALYKAAGDWVEAGERIAAVGQTGGYPDTGLYFEIRHKSKAINPLRFISRS
jgi:septal ring factor EnvC (AmiA/AmiB activator)